MENKEKVVKEMNISQAVAEYPEIAEIMMGYGLHCIGCHVSAYESIEQGAKSHGMDDKKIDEMLIEINNAINTRSDNAVMLTESAAEKFKELIKKEDKQGWGLKLSIEQGGCSGQNYAMDFVKGPESDDVVIEERGIQIFVSHSDLGEVKGTLIDYKQNAYGSGFRIFNPKAPQMSGCKPD